MYSFLPLNFFPTGLYFNEATILLAYSCDGHSRRCYKYSSRWKVELMYYFARCPLDYTHDNFLLKNMHICNSKGVQTDFFFTRFSLYTFIFFRRRRICKNTFNMYLWPIGILCKSTPSVPVSRIKCPLYYWTHGLM